MSAGAVEDAIVQQIISPHKSFSKGAEARGHTGDRETTQPAGGVDCSDPRLFNSRIRNFVCPAEQ